MLAEQWATICFPPSAALPAPSPSCSPRPAEKTPEQARTVGTATPHLQTRSLLTKATFLFQTGVFAMEISRPHSSYAFSTMGSGYTPQRSALYGRDQAISWHSCSIMGVPCLQQHVLNSPPGSHRQTHNCELIPQPPHCGRYSGHFNAVFQPLRGPFITGF